jgi:hypothetical protein
VTIAHDLPDMLNFFAKIFPLHETNVGNNTQTKNLYAIYTPKAMEAWFRTWQ